MPGPAKDNLRNNAGLVLTKEQAKAVRANLKYATGTVPEPETPEFYSFIGKLQKEAEELRNELAQLRARVDLIQVAGAGAALTL